MILWPLVKESLRIWVSSDLVFHLLKVQEMDLKLKQHSPVGNVPFITKVKFAALKIQSYLKISLPTVWKTLKTWLGSLVKDLICAIIHSKKRKTCRPQKFRHKCIHQTMRAQRPSIIPLKARRTILLWLSRKKFMTVISFSHLRPTLAPGIDRVLTIKCEKRLYLIHFFHKKVTFYSY